MLNRRNQYLLLAFMVLALFLSWQLTPTIDLSKRIPAETFANQIPIQFGEWQRVPRRTMAIDLYQKIDGERNTDNPYDDTFIQSYRNQHGQVVELAIAYGGLQRQEIKVHRPELCYYAQGYQVLSNTRNNIALSTIGGSIKGQSMQVRHGKEQQLVSYWIRIGDLFSQSAWQTRLYLITQGLLGNVPDGVLVRVSSVLPDRDANNEAWQALHQSFLNHLIKSIQGKQVELLLLGER